jgi:hypothetical protein
MTLKSALENKLISADKIASEYSDVLIKKWLQYFDITIWLMTKF